MQQLEECLHKTELFLQGAEVYLAALVLLYFCFIPLCNFKVNFAKIHLQAVFTSFILLPEAKELNFCLRAPHSRLFY